jgi:hypothetical protein
VFWLRIRVSWPLKQLSVSQMRLESFSEIVQLCLRFKVTTLCLILSCASPYSAVLSIITYTVYLSVHKFAQFWNREIQVSWHTRFQKRILV